MIKDRMDERRDLDRRISNAVSPLHGHWYASVLLCFCCLSVCVCVHVCACVCVRSREQCELEVSSGPYVYYSALYPVV